MLSIAVGKHRWVATDILFGFSFRRKAERWGNIMATATKDKYITAKLNLKTVNIQVAEPARRTFSNGRN
jgi:hypothetical protein